MTFMSVGTPTGVEKSIFKIGERIGNEKKNIPKIQEVNKNS